MKVFIKICLFEYFLGGFKLSNSDLIHFSRAGDIFHYRWAAKRCLKLLDFNTDLQQLTIEGSLEPDKAGECVVDVAEYYETENGERAVDYFQLKHTTTQLNKPFTLSLLKDTIVGFSKRFKEFSSKKNNFKTIHFSVVTNRPIAKSFKDNVEKLAKNQKANLSFIKTIKDYTKLTDAQLKKFCNALKFLDGEGNYDAQKYDVHKEIAQITCSKDISNLTKLLVAKIIEKIEPGKSNTVSINDVLEVFDITGIEQFFPAPPLFEEIPEYILRKQQDEIISSIKVSNNHTVITANGGVGKSILCQHITDAFNDESFIVAYDCFGNGGYRRTSQKRHRPVDAFTQVSNQLAKEGLCAPIIPTRREPDDYWMKAFLTRLSEASDYLKNNNDKALLVILFDAVDNAEMAAMDASDTCFATQLIREEVPENCRIVFTSRPDRVSYFDPPSSINKIELNPFTEKEALINLRNYYPDANTNDAKEFNRLTSCNPRVQANSFSLNIKTVAGLLSSFGAQPVSVDDLIEKKLEITILKLKDSFPKNHRDQIDSICTGLATLPPFVPLQVLAAVADVSIDTVKSFITELGRPLWMIDNAVQFRDEPTEKWFQDNFIATPKLLIKYIEKIKPLSTKYSYISETLPILMLKAGLFDDLVSLALSEELLPENRPFDARKIRVFRLQYAFKAALKKERYFEAGKLALRAGEEIAGDKRQIEILANNCDLTSRFLSAERVQELAHRKVIYGGWEGSETAYSSSLLSSIGECQGEARSYLRSAHHWLHRHIDKRDESKESEEQFHDKLDNRDILELAMTNYHLFGEHRAVDYILSWSPSSCIFIVTEMFIRRLVDSGKFESISIMAQHGKANPHFILALTSELMTVGKYPPKECLTRCLNKIINPSQRLKKPDAIHRSGCNTNTYLSFFEACLINMLPSKNILRALNYYIAPPRLYSVADDHQHYGDRSLFLRSISIRSALKNEFSIKVEDILPKEWTSKDSSQHDYSDLDKTKKLLEKLLPWHMVTAKILAGIDINLEEEHKVSEKKSEATHYLSYREHDPIAYEITSQKFKNIYLLNSDKSSEIQFFLNDFKEGKLKLTINDEINCIRVSCRQSKLEVLIDDVEASVNRALQSYGVDESPESYAELFISLARAVLNVSNTDSSSYFDKAIEIASNFGEEAVDRWNAIVTIAKKSAENNHSTPETAYRFMRCAELIGETVAREKYWNRDEALNTCFSLSPESAFSIASRWKDRRVGWSDRQIVTLANSAIDSELILSSALWCLSAFSWEYGLVDFCGKCLKAEPNEQKRQLIINDLIHDLRVKDTRGDIWKKVEVLATEYSLKHRELRHIEQLSDSEKNIRNKHSYQTDINSSEKDYELWAKEYSEFDITSLNGLNSAFHKFKKSKVPRNSEKFWAGCYIKLNSRNAADFLLLIAEAEFLDLYDIQGILKQFPSNWKEKLSVINAWLHAVKCISQRFPSQFTNDYHRKYFLAFLDDSSSTLDALQKGVIKGFSESVDLESASALFGFTHSCTSLISIKQAEQLLDYGLQRFEMHIDDAFADGLWGEALLPACNLNESLAMYIFTSLGAPENGDRWRAVHAVVRLYKLGMNEQIECLLDLMILDETNTFVSPSHPFYSMHAKLYLLVALSRCAIDNIDLLLGKSKIFSEMALKEEAHLLIQLYARNIALQIENYSKDTYDQPTLIQLKLLGKSQLPAISNDKYRYQATSTWLDKNLIESPKEFGFAYDFDRYWFEPLGRVFGISGKQVQNLAENTIFNEWKMQVKDKFTADPRADLWKHGRMEREAWHSHSDYPCTDDYRFYISYHAMHVVASKLIQNMPVVNNPDYDENNWNEWLERHLLMSSENYFRSELRDVFPIARRAWTSEKTSEDWRWEISADDFLEMLFCNNETSSWINVTGRWNEYDNGQNEKVSICSILIPKGLSNSFLNTINNFDNHIHESHLLDYCEDDFEYSNKGSDFKGKRWLKSEDSTYGLDESDPYSGDIDPSPYVVCPELASDFDLTSCNLDKYWYLNGSKEASIINEFWSDDKPTDRDSYYRVGKKAKVSLDFLMQVCQLLNVEVAIQVNIERSLVGRYNDRNHDDFGYIPAYSKTFIFSGDGKFRDSRKSYQFREKVNS